jgi:hypothetical protein
MDDKNDKLVAAVSGGILSPVLDSADVRKPLRLSDYEFDRLVQDLYLQGRCAIPDSTWIQ